MRIEKHFNGGEATFGSKTAPSGTNGGESGPLDKSIHIRITHPLV